MSSVSTISRNNIQGDLLPPPPKKPKIVLEEDEYIEQLGNIIERDFFPNINKLESKLEWINAIKSGNPEYLQGAQRNILKRRAGQKTPIGEGYLNQEQVLKVNQQSVYDSVRTELTTPSTINLQIDEKKNSAIDLKLNQYLARYTSEDNASFENVIDTENKQRLQKLKERAPQQILEESTDKKQQRFITDGYGTSGQQPKLISYPQNELKNNLFFGDRKSDFKAQLTDEESKTRTEGLLRKTHYENTNFPNPKNKHTDNNNNINSINNLTSKNPNLQHQYSTSTLQTPRTDSSTAYQSNNLNGIRQGDIAHQADKTPTLKNIHTPMQQSNQIPLDKQRLEEFDQRISKNGVVQYKEIETPSMAPNQEVPAILTWGEVEGTPLPLGNDEALDLNLEESEDYRINFSLQDTSKREALARILANKSRNVSTKSIAGYQTSFVTPTPTTPRHLSGLPTGQKLSEAGRKLLMQYRKNKNHHPSSHIQHSRRMNSITPLNNDIDYQLRSSYSKSPYQRPPMVKSQGSVHATPVMDTPLVQKRKG